MATTREKLLSLHLSEPEATSNKVSVVGVGQVGMACAFSMLLHVISLYFIKINVCFNII